ncbi:hypothetical protein GGQ84_002474 [Desulfitispora alkaliphila]|uniref:hypothetical protein n=1 Tax=Desulfitispora alkaliphila TaxID=622674 RepID=UPI003D1CFB77
MSIFWLIQAIAYWSLVVFLMPYSYIRRFLPFAFLGGFIYTWLVQYTAVNILNFWQFPSDIFMVFGIPFFFVFSWFGVTLLYGYILYRYPKDQLWVILFFVAWATINNYLSIAVNQIVFVSWSVTQTLMVAIFSHVILLYVFKVMHNVDELGAKDDILDFSLAVLKNKR